MVHDKIFKITMYQCFPSQHNNKFLYQEYHGPCCKWGVASGKWGGASGEGADLLDHKGAKPQKEHKEKSV